MLFLIDNYDSFTYNLVQYFEELGSVVRVARNDAVSQTRSPHCAPPGSSSPLGRDVPRMPARPCPSSAVSPGTSPSWACASATRPSPWRSAAGSSPPGA